MSDVPGISLGTYQVVISYARGHYSVASLIIGGQNLG